MTVSLLDIVLDRTFVRIWISLVILFGLSSSLSSLAYFSFREEARELLQKTIAERAELLAPGELAFPVILANNFLVALFSSLLSATIIVPVFVISFNGALVGSLVSAVLERGPTELTYTIYFLLAPHGALEVPALALASSAAAALLGGRSYLSYVLRSSALAFFMLLFAALVEQALILMAR